jgi:hypothetical protein
MENASVLVLEQIVLKVSVKFKINRNQRRMNPKKPNGLYSNFNNLAEQSAGKEALAEEVGDTEQ